MGPSAHGIAEDTPYDLLVKKRNQMIFDDNLQMSERQQDVVTGAQNTNVEAPARATNDLQARPKINEEPANNAASCHFTLNKYESRPDLQKKVAQNVEEFDSQVQTAHFKK